MDTSSFYWSSVANGPNILQPYWLIVLPLDVPVSPLVSFYEVLAATGGDVYEPSYFSNVPTFATSRLREILAVKGGTTWARNGRWILPENTRLPFNAVNLRHWTDGFTSPLKEGMLRIFSPWKIQLLRSGLNQRTWVPKASTLPLDHRYLAYRLGGHCLDWSGSG